MQVLLCILLLLLLHLMAAFSRTTWVIQHQKGRTILDFNEARDDGVTVTSVGPYAHHIYLNPESRQHHITHIFTGQMLFLPPNQKCQSIEGIAYKNKFLTTFMWQAHHKVYNCKIYDFNQASEYKCSLTTAD